MKRRIVLVPGVPGVGKTTLINAYITQHPGWVRVSGGDMVLAMTPEIADRDTLRNRPLRQIYADQMKMGAGLANLLLTLPEDVSILFDGHATLRTFDGRLLPVLWRAFRPCNPTQIVCLTAPPEIILQRREADATLRNREVETPEQLAWRQDLTRKVCRGYARLGGLPLTELNCPTVEELHTILEDIP